MKTNMKLNLVATAAVVLASGLLSQSAKAVPVVIGDVYDVTLTDQGPGLYTGDSFIADSQVLAPHTGGNTSSEYMYYYQFGEGNHPSPPVPITDVSVYFDNSLGLADTAQGGIFQNITPTDVEWQFGSGLSTGSFNFLSPYAPTLGYMSAHDGGLWGAVGGGNQFGVVVPMAPTIPDSATTLSLLGGALVGLGALRRKIGC